MISDNFAVPDWVLSSFWITFWHTQVCKIIQDSCDFLAFLIILQTALYPYKEISTEKMYETSQVGYTETCVGHVREDKTMYTLHSHLLLLFLSSYSFFFLPIYFIHLLYSTFPQSFQLLTSNLPTT